MFYPRWDIHINEICNLNICPFLQRPTTNLTVLTWHCRGMLPWLICVQRCFHPCYVHGSGPGHNSHSSASHTIPSVCACHTGREKVDSFEMKGLYKPLILISDVPSLCAHHRWSQGTGQRRRNHVKLQHLNQFNIWICHSYNYESIVFVVEE